MKLLRILLAALALIGMPSLVSAQAFLPGKAISDTNPQPTSCKYWNGTAWAQCPTGGGGGGGAATIANGADTAEGSTTDAPYTDGTGAAAGTLIGISKAEFAKLLTLAGTVASTGSPASTAQTIQASALPLPTGAATSANQTATGASAQTVQGGVASGATDAGAPVKAGGRYNATSPTFTDGQRGDLQLDSAGDLSSAPPAIGGASADGVANARGGELFNSNTHTSSGVQIEVRPFLWNGTTYDRAPGSTIGASVVSRGGASLATGQVSVGTTATLIAAARTGRQSIVVTVTAAVQCSFGNSGVTTATGFPLAATAYVSYKIDTAAAVYGACATAATNVGYMEAF